MDQEKIGKFIASCRKKQNLTQAELAEKLCITDRAISKWENGRGMPDSSIMLELCNVLNITVNDLLNGEVVSMSNYDQKYEQMLLEMVKQKQDSDRKMLSLEWVIGILSVIIILSFSIIAKYFEMEESVRIILAISGLVIGLIGLLFATRIEQTAGYYKCKKCGEKHVPKYLSVLGAMHFGRTRYMKCPKCGKKTWNKKTINAD